jgi:hypothetical protein
VWCKWHLFQDLSRDLFPGGVSPHTQSQQVERTSVALLPATRKGMTAAPPMQQAFGPLSGAVEHPAGASPSKCYLFIHSFDFLRGIDRRSAMSIGYVLNLYKRASWRLQKSVLVESAHEPLIRTADVDLRLEAFSSDCECFSNAWFSSDFPRLLELLPILHRNADLMSFDSGECGELPLYLIEIVDLHDSENSALRDFEEADQGIVALAFELFSAFVFHSSGFSSGTLSGMAETAVRVFPDLSPD